MISEPVATFVDSLRRSRLIESNRWIELESSVIVEHVEPRTLAEDLVDRSWLTPFQADQILRGTGLPLVLGPYTVLEPIGEGGMGRVYKARHRMMDRVVALKVIREALLDQPDAALRFDREIRSAARLSHPNIVTAHDAAREGSAHFLVMEYVEGIDLGQLVKDKGPLPSGLVCDYAIQAAHGLQHALDRGIIHRDIKPSNLRVTADGSLLKVLDLGLARLAIATPELAGETLSIELTGSGIYMGTADYLSPEQAMDARRADARSDVYSLGCTLYHLLAGRPPFPGGTPMEKLIRHREIDPVPIRALRPDLPMGLDAVLRKMMAKRPDDRFPSHDGVARALEPYRVRSQAIIDTIEARPETGATEETSAIPAEEPATKRRGWGIARVAGLAVAGLLVVAMAAGLVLRLRGRDGTLVVNLMEPDVEVTIDDGRMTIDSRKVGRVELAPGDHELRVRRKDEELFARSFTLRSGGEVIIDAKWEPALRTAPTPIPTASTSSGPVLCREVAKFDGSTGFGVWHVVSSPDGRTALSGGLDRVARLWNSATGREIRAFRGHRDSVVRVAFSPDGRRILTGDGEQVVDGKLPENLRLWDVASGAQLRVLRGHTGEITAIAFTADGARALSGSKDRTIRLWDLESGSEVRRFEGHSGPVYNLALSPDGRAVVSAGHDGSIRTWDFETAREVGRLDAQVHTADFSRDARRVILGGNDGLLQHLDLQAGSLLRRTAGPGFSIWCVAYSPDGRHALSTSGKSALLWNLDDLRLVARLEGHTAEVCKVAFTPDGRRALSCGNDFSARVWDLSAAIDAPAPPPAPSPQPPAEVRRYWGHTDRVWAMALSTDGTLALSGGPDRTVRLWDVASGRELRRFPGHQSFVAAVALSTDNRLGLSGGGWWLVDGKWENGVDPAIRLWDLGSGQEVRRLDGHTGQVTGLGFTNDGRRAISSSDDASVRLWELETGLEIHRMIGHSGAISEVTLTPDNLKAVSAGADGTVRVWDLARGEEVACLRGHSRRVWHVAVSADGRRALSGGDDSMIRLWDLETYREILGFEGQADRIRSLSIAPDGRMALSGDGVGKLRLWDLADGRLISVWPGHGSEVSSAWVLPGGSQALSSANDATLALWNLPSQPVRPKVSRPDD